MRCRKVCIGYAQKKTLPVLNSVLAFSVCVKSHIWSNVFYVELELFSTKCKSLTNPNNYDS